MLGILNPLTNALKKIVDQFPEDQKTISFLIATSLPQQGCTSIFKQTNLQHVQIEVDLAIELFYNSSGIILEISADLFQKIGGNLSQLFKRLNKCHRKLHISGFLFCIDIQDLLLNEQDDQTLKFKSHAKHFQTFIRALDYPVRTGLIITKLDQITGFTDFFHLSHQLELQEALGFSINHAKEDQHFFRIFSESWSNFVAHLNQMMIQKVHTTRANKKRVLIREFPLQMALLESKFLSLFKHLAAERNQIHGIYFTSAEQKGRNINYLNQKIQNDFSLMVPIHSVQSVNHKAYFVQGAIKHNQELSSYAPQPKILDDKNLQLSLGATICLSLYIMFQTVKTHQVILNAEHVFNQETRLSQQFDMRKLENLDQALRSLEHLPFLFGHIQTIQLFKTQIFQFEKNSYKKNLAQQMMIELAQGLMQSDVRKSFEALRVYKAIESKDKNQTEVILTWFNQGNKAKTLQARQETLLMKKFLWQIHWPLPSQAMQSAENILNALSPDYLAYELISPKLVTNFETLATPGFEQEELKIPKCFTKQGFSETLKQISQELKNLQQNNTAIRGLNQEDTLTKIHQHYARKYILWWTSLEKNLRPKRFENFNDAQTLLTHLSQAQSIDKIMARMESETKPNMENPYDAFNQLIASQFTELQLAKTHIANINPLLSDCEKFLKMLNIFNEDGRASYQYLKAYFNQSQFNDALYNLSEYAKRSPQPLQTWINEIKDEIWMLIIQSGKQYLNENWKTSIYAPYQENIIGKYPFSNSNEEISIDAFEKIFSPNGVIQKYYQDFLQPFIDSTQAQWKIKEVEHRQLPIDPQMIQKLIQANIITTMFFPNNREHLRTQFSLEKMSLDPVVAKLKLEIGEQVYEDKQSESQSVEDLIWPANNAKLWMQTVDGKQYQIEEKGTWGFYRLLEQINVLNDVNDPANLQILLEINGNSGRYLLKTNQAINPFMPSILKQFELKEKILE